MTKLWRPLAAVFALALVVGACGDDSDDGSSEPDPVESTAPSDSEPDETPDPDTDAPEDPGTIVEVAMATDGFSTLVAAVQAADPVVLETLTGEGPYTVFAPTDDAFAAALDALDLTADELLADTETLTAILTYHVVEGAVPASDVVGLDGQSVDTLNGAAVDVSVDGDTVMVNDATVVQTDVMASNGVIHVIDAVLVPPAS